MDQASASSTSIMEAANLGISAVAALLKYSSDRQSQSLATTISLSSSVLSQIGEVVAQNEAYFKHGFVTMFSEVIEKFKMEYGTIIAGIKKAKSLQREGSETKDPPSIEKAKSLQKDSETKGPPKKWWDKLLWAMEMKDEIADFNESLEVSMGLVSMLSSVVMLIVLQCYAKERELNISEQADLLHEKKNIGKLLEALRDAKIAHTAFSLIDQDKPANLSQLTKVDDQLDFISTTTLVPSLQDLNTSYKPVTSSLDEPLAVKDTQQKNPEILELYVASYNSSGKVLKQSTLRIFGIPFTVRRIDIIAFSDFVKIIAPQDEIKSLLMAAKANPAVKHPLDLESMLQVPEMVRSAIAALLNSKSVGPGKPPQPYKWTIECLIPKSSPGTSRWRFWTKKGSNSYILILGGETRHRAPPPPLPSAKRVVFNPNAAKETKSAAQIDLTQGEAEIMVNDFLALFSTLYVDIAPEERGAALRAIKIGTDDEGYDSDESSSSGSPSVVD